MSRWSVGSVRICVPAVSSSPRNSRSTSCRPQPPRPSPRPRPHDAKHELSICSRITHVASTFPPKKKLRRGGWGENAVRTDKRTNQRPNGARQQAGECVCVKVYFRRNRFCWWACLDLEIFPQYGKSIANQLAEFFVNMCRNMLLCVCVCAPDNNRYIRMTVPGAGRRTLRSACAVWAPRRPASAANRTQASAARRWRLLGTDCCCCCCC